MSAPKKITAMFAFVVEEADGGEGVPAFTVGLYWYPLMGADLERIESLRAVAQGLSNTLGKPFKIVKFTGMEQIGEIKPQ